MKKNLKNMLFVRETISTNALMKDIHCKDKPDEGFVVYTDYQSAGRGLGTNSWEAKAGKNVLFSILLYPHHIKPSEQFVISQIVSIAIWEVLSEIISNVKIKWPNDIYVNNKKIAGILIENTIQGNCISKTIIGIGLNVNQTKFESDAPNPVSLKLVTGKSHNRLSLITKICNKIVFLYQLVNYDLLKENYFNNLFRNNGFFPYHSDSGSFNAKIIDVKEDGRISLLKENGEVKLFGFKEVEFVINP